VGNSGAAGTKDRGSPNFTTRHRARFEVDTRTQTGYGTLRNYEAFQVEAASTGQGGAASSATVTRAFIQWAGFTFGHAQSLSDTWDLDDAWRYIPQENSGSTGANGVNRIAYTWEVGNGMALTVGADEAIRKALTNLSSPTALKIGSAPSTNFAAEKWPDPFVAYNVNQAWGRFAAAAKFHDVSATYYDTTGTINTVNCPPNQTNTTQCLYPDDKVGWGAAAGAEIKMDWITPGDRFGASFHYAQGLLAFAFQRQTGPGLFGSGNQVGFGWVSDGVFVNGGQIELTTAWTVQAGFEHYWTPSLKTDFTGAYGEIHYNDTAASYFNKQLGGICTPTLANNAAKSTNVSAGAAVGSNACDPNYQYFQGGIRTQWNVTKSFFLGVDVAYDRVFTSYEGTGILLSSSGQNGFRPTGTYAFKDQGEFVTTFRAFSAF
jgi:hypothetical protein